MELNPCWVVREAPRESCTVLWRMQGPRRVVKATLWHQAHGHELVIAFEDDELEIIETQFSEFDVEALQERAAALKLVLEAKGWSSASTG